MRFLEFMVIGVWLVAVSKSDASSSLDPPVIYDVTTIYRLKEPLPGSNTSQAFSSIEKTAHPGVLEVHARTNARGLPFLLNNETILGPNVGVFLPDWLPSKKTTSGYTSNNFTRSSIKTDQESPIDLRGEVFNYESDNVNWYNNHANPRRCGSRHLEMQFEITALNQRQWSFDPSELLVFLVESRQYIYEGDTTYLIRFTNMETILYKCRWSSPKNSEEDTYYVDVTIVPDTCEVIETQTFHWDFTVGEKYYVAIDMGYRTLTVKASTKGYPKTTAVFDWTDSTTTIFEWTGLDPQSENVYFAAGNTGFLAYVTAKSFSDEGLVLNEPTGSVVSPPLPLALDKICVSLVFYSSQTASIDLHLQHGTTLSSIGRLEGQAGPKASWSRQVLVVDIPDISDLETRLVIMATRPDNETLIIQRIAGCNSDDPEDVLELPQSTITTIERGIDVAHHNTYSLSANNKCLNGGLQVVQRANDTEESATCICPPGFTGYRCSEGCGANSYGSDCGGVCSGSKRGCRGMVMCKPMMDCDCAPGYKGIYCDRNCNRGEYGAGCRQICGHCATDTCDIYTGVCYQGCEPGFIQPYCKESLAYLSSAPQVFVNSSVNVSVSGNLASLEGKGTPRYYQLQYKKNGIHLWHKEVPKPIPEDKENSGSSFLKLGDVTGLEQGTDYLMRVVLIDQNLDSYEGDLVPSVAFSTPCIIPRQMDYAAAVEASSSKISLKTKLVEDTEFEVEWQIPSTNVMWCRLIGYEVHVKMDWRWMTYSVDADVNSKHIKDLLPGRKYTVKVRAITSRGPASFTKPLVVTTLDKAPDYVVNLAATAMWERSLKVTWESPKHPAGTIRHYHIAYQCVRLGVCPEDDCSHFKGKMDVSTTSQLIEGLLPFAVYNISVAGVSGSVGPLAIIQAATSQSLPEVAPSSARVTISSRTNSSLRILWAPPENCQKINGFPAGYRYELLSAGQTTPLFVGTTPECSASFANLTPHTEYVIRVFVVTGAGWSTSRPLEITASTRATSPEMVQDLVVYKRGRRLLGLRWSPPRRSYGSLQSFTVSHSSVGGAEKSVSVSVKPTPCPAWPSSFCHTLNHLKQDTDYTITVQARNAEVDEDGEEVTITASTRESAPGAPSFLRVPNKTSDSLTIKWGLPDLINGQLRSFLVNIEETDSHNSSDCCQYFPIREVMVTSERLDYDFKMTGLRPASSYEVSVSAKTVAMGPALTLTVHTRPPSPVLVQAPTLEGAAVVGGPLRVRLEAAADYQGEQVSGYLLLLKDNSSVHPSPIRDEWLSEHLTQAVNGSFSLVAEFPKGKLPEGGVVDLRVGGLINEDGVFGRVGLTDLKTDTEYQLVWVLVLEYCNTLNEGHVISEPFTVGDA